MTTGDEAMDAFLAKCLDTMKTKGADYTQGSVDRLHNFRAAAAFLDVPMPTVWATYFYKHAAAIFSYCKRGQVESEPIEDRIQDCIVYLLLLVRIVRESKGSFGSGCESPSASPLPSCKRCSAACKGRMKGPLYWDAARCTCDCHRAVSP